MNDYHRPQSLKEAVAIAQTGATIAAGCTDLFPATAAKELPGSVLDMTGVSELARITRSDGGWRIGGIVTWSDLLRAELPPVFDVLKEAAREVGSVQIQNAGTLAGNLCNASPAADGVPPLLALAAEVELSRTAGLRRLPLSQFLCGPRQTALRPGEILSAVLIPEQDGVSTFLKLGARRYLVISIVMVAARLSVANGVIREAALSVGSCSAVAARLKAQEQALIGLALADAVAEVSPRLIEPHLSPIEDIRADASYRRGSASVLVRRAVAQLSDRLRG